MADKVVEVPGVGNVSFPDSMSDDQIGQVIRSHYVNTPDAFHAMLQQNLARNSKPTQFEKDRNPDNQQGGISSAMSELGGLAKGIPGMVAGAFEGPTGMARTAVETGAKIAADDTARKQDNRSGAYRAVAALGTPLGINGAKMEDQAAVGNTRGIAGTAIGDATPFVAAPLIAKYGPKVVDNIPSVRGSLAPRMAEVPAGEQFSRGEVLDAARQNGVNLDVAQATDSGVAKGLKKANEYSLTAQSTYDANSKGNVAALEQWANKSAETYSKDPATREVVGGQMQSKLKASLDEAKTSASNQFNELDSRAPASVDATNTVEAEARKIISDNKAYYDAHPELKPKQAWGILEDLAKRDVEKPAQAGQAGFTGKAPVAEQVASKKIMSWSELHQLRSDLMDFYRNNPDIVKGRGDAWIQRMVGKVDEAMTGASSGLSPEDLQTFREANHTWETVKNTFDNPQHPFYHAVRSQFASQVPGMLSKGTPELAAQVRTTLGSLEGPFQRQFVENLLNGKDGSLDLGRLNQKLKGIPQDHLEAMLGKDGAKQIRMLGQVAKRVIADSNPPGTAKVGVPAAELGGLIAAPLKTVPELAIQYAGSKIMNSPKVVDYLTKPKAKVTAPLPHGSRP
jgi:hypothetical protein